MPNPEKLIYSLFEGGFRDLINMAGEIADFIPKKGSRRLLDGYFDFQFAAVQNGDVFVETKVPTFTIQDQATLRVLAGDSLEIRGEKYQVFGMEPRVTGQIVLHLKKESELDKK